MEGTLSDSFVLDAEYREVLRIPDTEPEKPTRLSSVGMSFLSRFERLGDVVDIDKSISALEGAVQLIPDGHADRPNHLNNFGKSLLCRFERLGTVADISKSISTLEDAVRLTSSGDVHKPARLSNLGISFGLRFEHFGDVADINRSIATLEDAVQLIPDGHTDKPALLSNIGTLYLDRFERLGYMADINQSIAVLKDAVGFTSDDDADKPAHLSNLGNSFLGRFGRLGDVRDIESSISAQEDAILLVPDDHADRPGYLNNFGYLLLCHFNRFGDVATINKSIIALEDAVRLTPDDHPAKPARLNNLGDSFLGRFEHLGSVADVDSSISVLERAVQITPEDWAEKPGRLSSLGNAFLGRFSRLGDVSDIDKAVTAHEDAVRLTPDGHAAAPGRLNNLANSLQGRFELLGDVIDIDRSISALEDAMKLIPEGHPASPVLLSNLGNSVRKRFERTGDVASINISISMLENAVLFVPDSNTAKPDCLDTLGGLLLCRFKHLGDVADVDRSTLVLENALRLTPDDHMITSARRSNLGSSFITRFTSLNCVADLNKAVLLFSSAARSCMGSPSVRFLAALHWAEWSLETHADSLEAYSCALELLPRVAWLGLPIATRHRELAKIDSVVRNAAAVAIKAEKYDIALELLEQGRSIVWGQLLHLRTPIDDLREQDPVLADRLEKTSKELERASTRDAFVELDRRLSMEEAGRKHRQLALDWDELVERARAVPGFEDFLCPKRLSQLKSAARFGPVVVINVQKLRCDALIVAPDRDTVTHVPLERFSHNQAKDLQDSLNEVLSAAGLRIRSLRDPVRVHSHDDDEVFKVILSEIWSCVVKPILQNLAFPVCRTGDPPRIWWCPTGQLTFLPLHAAGLYNTTEPGSKMADFVTPSYTPTLTALLDTPRPPRHNEFQLLAITQPSTPGQSYLPGTNQELIHIQERAGQLSIRCLKGVEATVGRVLQGMKDCNWIHLACHGTQDAEDPTKSALLLQDGRLRLSEIIKTPLPWAEFAFLSACQTATGDRRLSEEAAHLAAGMLLAGYRGVIATTWSIKDNDAPLIADEVYARLFKEHRPDYTRAAHALHHAVQRLQERKNVSFLSWVPFIHVGL